MNLAIMMNKNPLMSIESQEKVMMGAPKLTVPRSTLNDCLCCLGHKTEITYNNCFPTRTRGILKPFIIAATDTSLGMNIFQETTTNSLMMQVDCGI